MNKLYFCDGYACDEYHKQCCWMHGEECCHTTKVEHALSKVVLDFPPTKFIPLPGRDSVVETLDEQGIFEEMRKGKELKLVESV